MNLIQKQKAFSVLVADLILQADFLGYEVTLGEAWRPPETARKYAEDGRGTANSNHCQKIAIDLNLFKDGVWLTKTSQYQELGLWWEEQSTDGLRCCWGGRFGDGNHFSVEHNGVR